LKVTAIFASKRRKPAQDKAFSPPPQLIHRQTVTRFDAFCINRKKNDATNRPIFSVHGKKLVNGHGQNRNGHTKSAGDGTFSTNVGAFSTNVGIKSVNDRMNLRPATKIYPTPVQKQPSLVKTPSTFVLATPSPANFSGHFTEFYQSLI
jgi:hypothetical protein